MNQAGTPYGPYLSMDYIWTLSDLSNWISGVIRSPKIQPNGLSAMIQMELKTLYPFFSFHLNLTRSKLDGEHIRLKFSIRFCNVENKTVCTYENQHCFQSEISCRLGESNFVEKESLLNSLINDTLVVFMKMTCETRSSSIGDNSEVGPSALLSSVGDRLLKDSKFKDLVISFGGIDLTVHRAVLAANSPVFEAMFEHDTVEKKTDRLQIDDIDPEIAKLFVQFMYCGTIEVLDMNIALELLRLADKYDMEHLKTYCADFIVQHVDNDNVAQVLISSDMFNAAKLRSHAIEYFCINKSMFDFEKFKSVLEERPSVLTDIIKKLSLLSVLPFLP